MKKAALNVQVKAKITSSFDFKITFYKAAILGNWFVTRKHLWSLVCQETMHYILNKHGQV